MKRGYFGIGVLYLKRETNYGTLFRSALCFDADFVFLIGRRFEKLSSDTTRCERHIPVFQFANLDDFIEHVPVGCLPVCIELCEHATEIRSFAHPERAAYLLGPENGSLPESITERFPTIFIPTSYCLNVAVAGSIVLYDRQIKEV